MPLPVKWQRFFVGRKVTHPIKTDLEGVVKYAASTRMGQKIPGQEESITTSFCVEWSDGTSQVMEDEDVVAIVTDEFVKEDWVLDRILKLQECGWNEAKADAAMNRTPSSNAVKSKSKGPAKSKSGAAASTRDGTKAGPSTANAVSVSLRDLKRQASSPGELAQDAKKIRSSLPLSSSQAANKLKQQQTQSTGAAINKLKNKSKAADDNSTNDEDDGVLNITNNTIGKATAARGPRNITFPSSPRGGRGGASGRGTRILSTLLHVSSLTFNKVRGKIVYAFDEVIVEGKKYRVYNKDLVIASSVCFRAEPADGKPADMTVDTWKVRGKYEQSEEYFVDCIAAERLTSSKRRKVRTTSAGHTPSQYEYLLKYTRFELDPGQESWLPYADVEQTAALDKWEKSGRKAYHAGLVAVKTAAGLEI